MAGAVSGSEPAPKCVAIAEKTEGFGRLLIDVERNVFAIEWTDETVTLGAFDEMIAVKDHIATHG